MEKVSKKNYEAPTMRVVEFRVENGFNGSNVEAPLTQSFRIKIGEATQNTTQHYDEVDVTSYFDRSL